MRPSSMYSQQSEDVEVQHGGGPSTSYVHPPPSNDVRPSRYAPRAYQLPRQSSLDAPEPVVNRMRPTIRHQHSLQTYGSAAFVAGPSAATMGAQHMVLGQMQLRPTEHEQRVVNEFQQLVDKSKQLFNGIRDLPLHGTRQWQGYFGRTFEIFTRLWKYQQHHRAVLDRYYRLKRWQIGEMASKIGQLYYHYYLRTSETTYLLETYSFYSAVRSRAYYSNVGFSDKSDLTVKKLRYYARFVVVCLLLKKLKLVRELVRELTHLVDEYIGRYEPDDQLEWTLILAEIRGFVDADNLVSIVDVDNSTVVLSHRLTAYNSPPLEKGVPVRLTLSEVILVGNMGQQVKCTELSLDMYWMLQALEREPHDESLMLQTGGTANSSPAPGRTPYDDIFIRTSGKENPHKYLLYRPSIAQLMLFLTCAYRDVPANGVLLLYISADGSFTNNPQQSNESNGYDVGGLCTSARSDDAPETSSTSIIEAEEETGVSRRMAEGLRDKNCIHPGDLFSYLRKPFFLVVESDNSNVFLGLPNLYNQPLVTFTGPVEMPAFLQIADRSSRGSVFTLFLHSPLTAFCHITNVAEIPIALWDKCQAHVDKFMNDAGKLLVRSPATDKAYIDFYSDDFLRLLILRFIFCAVTMRLHRSFRTSACHQPHSHPPLPTVDVLGHGSLQRFVLDLACILDVLAAFRDNDETVC